MTYYQNTRSRPSQQARPLDRPTIDDWMSAWIFRKVGQEYVGACPGRCRGEGDDRLRINSTGHVFCRVCCPDGQHVEALREIEAAVFGDRFSAQGSKSRQSAGNGSLSRPAPLGRNHTPQALCVQPAPESPSPALEFDPWLWYDSEPIPTPSIAGLTSSHPVRRWLGRRRLLHDWQTCPPAIRWHEAKGLIVAASWALDDIRASWPHLPKAPPVALHRIAIDGEGYKRYPPEWNEDEPDPEKWSQDKRDLGHKSAGVFALGDPEALGDPVHIVEGVADALAIYSRWPGLVFAGLGTTGMIHIADHPSVAARLANRRVLIHADEDENGEGLKAAKALHAALAWTTRGIRRYPEGDPADWSTSQEWPALDPAHFAEQSGRFLDSSEPIHEADRLALYLLTQSKETDR